MAVIIKLELSTNSFNNANGVIGDIVNLLDDYNCYIKTTSVTEEHTENKTPIK